MNEPLSAADRLDIHELLARYAWTFDTGDIEGFVACFAKDGTLIEDTFDRPDEYRGADAIRAMAQFFFSRPSFPGRQHHVSHILIDGGSGLARVRSFCFVTDCKDGPPYTLRFAGHYEDRVVKVDEGWLFQERVIRDWTGPVLARFPGQSGERVSRARPPELENPPVSG